MQHPFEMTDGRTIDRFVKTVETGTIKIKMQRQGRRWTGDPFRRIRLCRQGIAEK